MEISKVVEMTEPVRTPSPAPQSEKKKVNFKLIGIPLALVVLGLVSYFGYRSYLYVSTDDATIEARSILLSAKVGGIVVAAPVKENERVKKGQLLAQIQQDDYQNAVEQAEAQLESAQAQLRGAESNYRRVQNLFRASAYSKDKMDAAEAQYKSLVSMVKAASTTLAQAKLNLSFTQIVAPADGRVGKKSFEEGTLAAAGSPLMGFVYDDERWVTANMKETDLENISIGKPGYVEVDALGGKVYQGEVESISPNTGATFSMLPPDNATGNFTKVVQRVPVRIRLLNLTPADIERLQAGLSVEAYIKVH